MRLFLERSGLWIKPFQSAGEFYIYSAWNNVIHRVSSRLYRYFADDHESGGRDRQRQTAISLGLAPAGDVPLEVFPAAAIRDGFAGLQRNGPVRLVITVTEACNYRCRYCVFSGAYPFERRHGRRTMPVETAIRALLWYFHFPRKTYSIQFYGGEPLLERERIAHLVEEALKRAPPGARLRFGLTTNGSLLDDEAIAFMVEHDFDLAISLDGPAPVHNRYRRTRDGRPTYGQVWKRIRRIKALYPDYFASRVSFLMTLAPPFRIPELTGFWLRHEDVFAGKLPGLQILKDEPQSLYEALGPGADRKDIDLTQLRERYLARVIQGAVPDGLSRAACELSMKTLARRQMTSPATLAISAGQCVPGIRCHVTPDGGLHMCERATSCLPIGHVDTGFDQHRVEALLVRFREIILERCRDCWAVRLCRRCIVDFAAGPVLSAENLSALCAGRRRDLERDLADYCRARSRNDHCFDSLLTDEPDS